MRGFFAIVGVAGVIGLGYWAYHQNIQTQTSLGEVARLEREIAREREELAILRAEWAFLNRPDRLRDLAALNFERLRLMPMQPEQFGDINQVSYPRSEAEMLQDSASTPEGEDYP